MLDNFTLTDDFSTYTTGGTYRYIVAFGVTGFGAGNGTSTLICGPDSAGSEILVKGLVTNAQTHGIDITAARAGAVVDINGRVQGLRGIHLDGNKNYGENKGSIDVDETAVTLSGKNAKFTNTGSIDATYAFSIEAGADTALIINNGSITAQMGAFILANHVEFRFGAASSLDISEGGGLLVMGGTADQRLTVTNAGALTASTLLTGGTGQESVTNTGSMTGLLDFGGGNDTFDTSMGTFNGIARGGLGNDTFILGAAVNGIVEDVGGGTDTVKSTVTITLATGALAAQEIENLVLTGKKNSNAIGNDLANVITGNDRRNDLDGGAGTDTLSGGKGNDVLTGGTEADKFVFKTGFGLDVITDFTAGEDSVDVRGWKAIKNFNDMLTHAEKHGPDTWIVDGDDVLILEDVRAKDLDKADFQI